MRRGRISSLISLAATIFIGSLIVIIINPSGVSANLGSQPRTGLEMRYQTQVDSGPIVSNEVCLECHGAPGLTMTLENGDILDLFVDPEHYAASVHGKDGYACVQCHTDLGDYPHPSFTATDLRDVSLQLT